MDPVILSLISGGAGTVLGFALSEVAGFVRERSRKQEQIHSVRTLLRLEIEQNLARLDEYWTQRVQQHEGGEMLAVDFQKRLNLIQHPIPTWGRLMWGSQAAVLPLALSQGQLTQVFTLYAKLEHFSVLRSRLAEALPPALLEQYNLWRATAPQDRRETYKTGLPMYGGNKVLVIFRERPPVLGHQLDHFNTITAPFWTECDGIFQELYNKGNPLTAPTPARARLFANIKHRLPGPKTLSPAS